VLNVRNKPITLQHWRLIAERYFGPGAVAYIDNRIEDAQDYLNEVEEHEYQMMDKLYKAEFGNDS
jgi:hypothetical protein